MSNAFDRTNYQTQEPDTIVVGDRTKFYYLKYLDIYYDKYNDVIKNIVKFVGKMDFFKSNSK